ncbi:zinc finger BED domain-containing protein RICESLEEPER 2-like [Apium graveolens]|uniref:zinc finger BED domain-containing protein RICESLEEPER 2-like n=1 Tax=Apium graveolens TaxID=4045 RepID=UPI003D7AA95D
MENEETGPKTESSVKPEKEKGIKRKWSKAWDTFDLFKGIGDEPDIAKCKKCGYTVTYNSATGTGNLLKHQKIFVISSDIRQMIISKSQGSMLVHNGAFDPKIFRDMITEVVVKHNLPLSFVEYEGIREAFLYANPRATLASRNTLRNDILINYKTEKRKLLNMLKSCGSRVCLTSDLWTSVATDGYITITAHFITDDWVLHKKLLNFSYVPSPHMGMTISDKIYKLLCEWNLKFKLFSITLDNALSNDAFVGTLRTQLNLRNALLFRGEFFHIRFCAHILNLIVQEGLKDMDASVDKIRESVKTLKVPKPIGLSGMSDKFSGGASFSHWHKKMKLWSTVKGLWPMVQYDPPLLDQEKVESVKAYALWAEKDGVARVAILAALVNTLFDVYSSDDYIAKEQHKSK